MSHTQHSGEARNEGKAKSGQQAAKATCDSRRVATLDGRARGSSPHISSNASAAGTARRLRKGRAGVPHSIAELTIDLDDDRVLEAVANLLLDLTRHKYEGRQT